MLHTLFTTVVLFAGLVSSAVLPEVAPRATTPSTSTCTSLNSNIGTYNGVYSASCSILVKKCIKGLNHSPDIWSVPSCLAASTCQGPQDLVDLTKCSQTAKGYSFPDRADTWYLNYSLYTSIVGDCAYGSGGCSIDQQHFVDFVFGVLSDLSASDYPTYDDVVNLWWTPIVEWTNKGTSVPYTNFMDWLRYA